MHVLQHIFVDCSPGCLSLARINKLILHHQLSVSYGRWRVEYGCGRVDYGCWRFEYGGWIIEYGGWSVANGGWTVENAGWRVEYGGWRVLYWFLIRQFVIVFIPQQQSDLPVIIETWVLEKINTDEVMSRYRCSEYHCVMMFRFQYVLWKRMKYICAKANGYIDHCQCWLIQKSRRRHTLKYLLAQLFFLSKLHKQATLVMQEAHSCLNPPTLRHLLHAEQSCFHPTEHFTCMHSLSQ